MRARHFLAFVAAGLTAAVGVGCDGNADGTGGGGSGGDGGTGGTTTTSTTATTTTTTTGTGGTVGDGNDTFDTAEDLPLAEEIAGTLDPAAEDSDFYTFEGEANAPFIITTTAKIGNDPFDPTYLDLVVTLYDANKNQIARNDDPIPRFSNDPLLFTFLPTAGTYYIEVSECSKVFGADNCAEPGNIEVLDYTISAGFLALDAPTIGAEMEPNDTIAAATDISAKYAESDTNPGVYGVTTALGLFDTDADVDVFKFRIPANLDFDAAVERSVGYFDIWPSGKDGDGSDTKVGKLWITDDAGVVIASIDNNVSAMEDGAQSCSPPLMVDTDYFLHVQSPGGSDGMNDFYFLRELVSGSNPLEADDAANNMAAGAQALATAMGDPNRYFFEGNISMDGDVDYFTAAVPANLMMKQVGVFCGAQRSGSGLRGFKVTVSNDADDVMIGSATEAANADASVQATAVGTATTVRIKVEATMPKDAGVMSDFYRCGVVFL